MFPTVPIVCPFETFSPTVTNSAVRRLAYLVSNPSECSIITVIPYLGSFLIAVTVPSSAAFTTVVLSALISIPVCVTHSFSVSEYIKLSFAYSFKISPLTGYTNDNSFFGSSFFAVFSLLSLSFLFSFFSSFFVSILVSVFSSFFTSVCVFSSFVVICSCLISFFTSSIVFPNTATYRFTWFYSFLYASNFF